LSIPSWWSMISWTSLVCRWPATWYKVAENERKEIQEVELKHPWKVRKLNKKFLQLNFIFYCTGQETSAYKVSCWGKSKSSEESQKTTKEREADANEHCKRWNQNRSLSLYELNQTLLKWQHWWNLLTNIYIACNESKLSGRPEMQLLYQQCF
jgi:hypothetical protein